MPEAGCEQRRVEQGKVECIPAWREDPEILSSQWCPALWTVAEASYDMISQFQVI